MTITAVPDLATLPVLDSPACTMPEYADYPRHCYLVEGSTVLVKASTAEEVIAKATPYRSHTSARIVRVPVNYDGRAVGLPAAPGGTWGGRCGSALWIHDVDRHFQRTFQTLRALDPSLWSIQPGHLDNHRCLTSQAWWINGVADRHPEIDGFWVECRHPYRHLGNCEALGREWDWRDYAPYTDRGHNTQLALF